MECVEAALKTSCSRKEMGFTLSPQVFGDEFGPFNTQNGSASDDFFVNQLLDFSNVEEHQELDEEEEDDEEDDEENDKSSAALSISHQHDQNTHNSNGSISFSDKTLLFSVPTTELSVPADDLADLEWLSHFVEDSFSEYSEFPAEILRQKPVKQTKTRSEPEASPQLCFETPVPAKARTKRTRTGGRVWSLNSPSLTESSSGSTTSSSSSLSSHWLIYHTATTQNIEPFEPVCSLEKPPAKKLKKTLAEDGVGGGGAQQPRRCSHCGVQETPQWRAGPLGAKTLCNACGVRYKSGRLLPEYRPACSPTFSSELHSNHHRKVLEMRRKKETETPPGGAESGCTQFLKLERS